MKFTDVRTLESVLAEYGMSSGASTPTSQQKTGATAKANAKPTTPTTTKVDKGSPTVTPGLDVKDAEPEKVEPTYTKSKAKDIEVDAEYHNDKGEVAGKVVSKVGNKPNPDKVVIQDPKGEYQLVDPDEEVQVLNASKLSKLSKSTASSFNIKKHSKKRLAKLKTNMKKLVRKFKLREQGPEQIFEINFNRKNIAQQALNSPIKCGFEAETVFQDVMDSGSDDDDWLYEYNWYDIEDFIRDQEGSGSVETINEAYREWIYEKAYDLEGEIMQDIVADRKEDEDELNDFVESMLDEDDIEAYKEEELEGMDDEQKEEFEDWDFIAWGRQYAEEQREDEYIEWLEEKIRDNGEALETAVETAESEYDHDEWANREYGSWSSCLGEHGIYLYDESGSGEGVGEVADMLRNWATDNSKVSDDVEHGEYHSSYGTNNDFWRVETDSSIETDGGTGAEVISPVYDTPKQMMEEMKSLFDWFQKENVETNSSCGLHITMSLDSEEKEEVNPVKLAVLLGDKYLLSTFGRSNNSYAKSQIESLKKAAQDLKSSPENTKTIKNIESIIGKGINRGKFSSINFKDQTDSQTGNQLIEFRIGGGNDYHLNFDTAAKAVIRYAETLSAAYSDKMYNADYVKALFKLINSLDEIDAKDIERVKGRFDVELPIVDVIKDYFDKAIYIDSMDSVAVAVNSLIRYREFSQPNADEQWKQALADYEERTGKKVEVEEVEEMEPLQAQEPITRPYKQAPSKQAPLYLKKAQENFALAIGQAGFDLSSNKSRAKPNAKSIGEFRKSLADFELTYDKLDKLILQQEDRVQVPNKAQSTPQKKLTTIQNGVNKLFKKDILTLPAFLSGPDSDKIIKGLWSATQSGALQDGEQNKKFFNALASATNVNAETVAAAWDSVNKNEFKKFNQDMTRGSYNSTGINSDNSWFPVGSPVNKAGLKKLLTHLADYEEWNHPVKKGHNPQVSGDDSYTDNALSKMQINLRKRFEEIQRMKDVQPAQHYDMLKVVSKSLTELLSAVQATDKMMPEMDPSLKGDEAHGMSQDGLDYFGMRSSQAETLTTIARQLANPAGADPFSETPLIQVQQQLQQYLNDVFERNHLAKAKYGADVFTRGKLPELIKTRTDAISKFINTVDKLGKELGFDSTGIDVDKKKQLPKKQKQFMKKHGDPSIAKIKAFSFGGDVMVKKEFAKELSTLGERELTSRLQQSNSIHSTNYKDILIMPWAHSSAIRDAIEILNNPEKYKDNWRWPVAEEMKTRFINKYGYDYESVFDHFVSYNESNIKQILQKRGVEFTDELGDGREPNFAPLVTPDVAKGPDGEPFSPTSATVWKMNKENAFDEFDGLPLEEQINIINKVSKDKIDKLYENKDDLPSGYHKWKVSYKDGRTEEVIAQSTYGVRRKLGNGKDVSKKELGVKSIKKIPQIGRKPKGSFGFNNKGFTKDQRDLKKIKDKEFEKDPGSYVHDRNMSHANIEESVPDFKQVDTINRLMSDHFPVGDLKKQMLAYQAIPVPAMLDHFRQLRAEAGDDACARNILQMFVGVLPDETKAKIRMTEWSKQHIKNLLLTESDNKSDAKELVQKSSTQSVLATVVNYLRSIVSKQEPEASEQDADQDYEQHDDKQQLVKEDLAQLKQEAFDLIGQVEDVTELNKLVAFLKKNEITELAHAAITANISQGVKGDLDQKIANLVLETPGDFASKEKFLKDLGTGNGLWSGNVLISNLTGNIYDMLSSNPIANALAKPIALQLRGAMGYGPDQGPGEFLLALTGGGIDLAEKSDLVLIDGKGVEVKADGTSIGKSGKKSRSGGRLYSTGGYNGGSGARQVVKQAFMDLGITEDDLEQFGWNGKVKGLTYFNLNFNMAGIKNMNKVLEKTPAGSAEKILHAIAKGFYIDVPENTDAFKKMISSYSGNEIDPKEAIFNFVALGHDYYKLKEGHDYIMIFNTATGEYVMIKDASDMKQLLDSGKVKLNGGMDFFDDRSKGTPQILTGVL